jgi:hypothetical protein
LARQIVCKQRDQIRLNSIGATLRRSDDDRAVPLYVQLPGTGRSICHQGELELLPVNVCLIPRLMNLPTVQHVANDNQGEVDHDEHVPLAKAIGT